MKRAPSLVRLAATLAACLVGCGQDLAEPIGEPIIIDGSSTVYRISRAAQEAYDEVEPGVEVNVNRHGTGGGFGAYFRDEVDIIDASRPAKASEEAAAKAAGLDWTRFHVGYDGVTLVVNPANTFVQSLSVAQLKRLWEPDSTVKTWQDLDPAWPDREIVLYSPDNDSGTFEFFTEAIVGKARAQRKDVQASPDDNTLVQGVAGDPDALGYFGFAYFTANADRLRAVAIEAEPGAKPVLPGEATILDKTYSPLSRRLYIYVKNRSLKRPEVAGFVTYYLEHIDELVRAGGYVPPTTDDQAANRQSMPGVKARRTRTTSKPVESPTS